MAESDLANIASQLRIMRNNLVRKTFENKTPSEVVDYLTKYTQNEGNLEMAHHYLTNFAPIGFADKVMEEAERQNVPYK